MQTFRSSVILFCFIVCACNNKNPNINKEELITELTTESEQEKSHQTITIENTEQDTIVTDMRMVGTTPVMKNWKNYFLENNKYKDWDKSDSKRTMVTYVVEKNGKATDVKVSNSSGNDDLDKEAVRLIQGGEFTVGQDMNGQYIRTGKMFIVVHFPPQQ